MEEEITRLNKELSKLSSNTSQEETTSEEPNPFANESSQIFQEATGKSLSYLFIELTMKRWNIRSEKAPQQFAEKIEKMYGLNRDDSAAC